MFGKTQHVEDIPQHAAHVCWFPCPLSLTPPCPHSCALPLQEMVVHGVPTTAPFHCLILENEEFKKGNVDTGFIPKHQESLTVRRGGLEAAGTGRLVWVRSSAHAATRWRCL